MNKKLMLVPALAITLVLALGGIAQAKQRDEDKEGRRFRNRKEHGSKIELMMMWKLTKVLDLDEKTAAKLFPLMHKYDTKQRDLRQNRHALIKQMKAEIDNDEADTVVLRRLIKEFKENERDMVKMRNERLDGLSEFLSEEQIAKMIIFVPRFERNVREMIGDMRARHGKRGKMSRDKGNMPPMRGQLPPIEE